MLSDDSQLRSQMCDIGRNLWLKNMVAANDGNLSIRIDQDRVLCTPTGVSKGFLDPAQLAVVDMSGTVLSDTLAPSSEIKMHLRVYQEDPSIMAVCHAHPTYATLAALRGQGIESLMLPEIIVGLGKVPLAPYGTPSTSEVPDAVGPLVKGHKACLLQNHGALTWGEDLLQAYFTMERLESTAKLLALAELLGGGQDLPEHKLEELTKLFSITY